MDFPKYHAKQKGFLEDVMLLVIKGFFAIESSGIMNLVAKIGIQIMLKGYISI
jgi:hypothetical protein